MAVDESYVQNGKILSRSMLVALPRRRCASVASVGGDGARTRKGRKNCVPRGGYEMLYKQCHNKNLKEERRQSQEH